MFATIHIGSVVIGVIVGAIGGALGSYLFLRNNPKIAADVKNVANTVTGTNK